MFDQGKGTVFFFFTGKSLCPTVEPREKPQGGGVFIWASLKIAQKIQIKTPPLIVCFHNFGLSEEIRFQNIFNQTDQKMTPPSKSGSFFDLRVILVLF